MLAITLSLLFAAPSMATADCYEANPILLSSWKWSLGEAKEVNYQLPTHTHQGPILTNAVFALQWNQGIAATLMFPSSTDTFSLPYSVHRWKLTIHFSDHTEVIDRDLTNDCNALPPSVYPGEMVRFPHEKVPFSHANSEAIFELQVWGR